MKLLRSLALLALLSLSSTLQAVWDLHDVSILLPLPQSTRARPFLAPSTQGGFGELLPDAYITLLPRLAPSVIDDPFSPLQVVGIRLDPCFVTNCQPQIRLVFQPVIDGEHGTTTVDTAVHAFYNLTTAEFTQLMNRLRDLKVRRGLRDTTLPLGVHPVLKVDGLASRYAMELQRILLDFLGVKKLSRMTFMTLDTQSRKMWTFGGFDIAAPGAQPERLAIPRIPSDQFFQAFINSHLDRTEFIGGMRPAPAQGDTFNGIVGRSDSIGNPVVVTTSVESTHRIENPRIHSPATIDCASCHVAQAARLWAIRRFPSEGFDRSPSRFMSPLRLNLDNTSPTAGKTHVLRAFGYDDDAPAVSQRTIYESALVLERLNKLGL